MRKRQMVSRACALALGAALIAAKRGCPVYAESILTEGKTDMQTDTEADQDKEEIQTQRIGIALYSLENEYTQRFAQAVLDYAQELQIEVVLYDGEYDAQTQYQQIEQMLALPVDGILLLPQNAEESEPCVKLSYEAGIPLVAVNTRVESEFLTAYVGSDDVTAGQMLMQALAQELDGRGNIVILEGPVGQSAQIERLAGIRSVLTDYPDIRVLSVKTARWSRLEAQTMTQHWLETFDQVDGIAAENDDMALGALEALAQNGKNAVVTGVNGSQEALLKVQEGAMAMTVYQDASLQVQTAMDVLLKAAAGEQVEKEYLVPLTPVTIENAGQYISTGE